MSSNKPTTALLIGASGNNGKRVLANLLSRGVKVRAIVRKATSLERFASNELCQPIEASILDIKEFDFIEHVKGTDVVISCLGHNLNMNGLFGSPHYLCRDATQKIVDAVHKIKPSESKIKVILHGSIGADNPDGQDPQRSFGEKCVLALLRGVAANRGECVLRISVVHGSTER